MTGQRPSPDRAPGELSPLPALAAIVAVARFQIDRLLTPPRLALAAIGVIFPTAVLLAAAKARDASLEHDLGAILL